MWLRRCGQGCVFSSKRVQRNAGCESGYVSCVRFFWRCSYLECGDYFCGPLHLSVTCSRLVLPEEYRNLEFLGMTPGFGPVFSILRGSTADTCSCQSTEAVGISHVFHVKVDTRSGSRLFGAWLSPEKYRNCEMTSRSWTPVFSVLARQWIHARASENRVFFC